MVVRLLNNLGINKSLYLALGSILAMAVLVGLEALGLDIPVLRQVVGFTVLTLVPGMLILRILRVNNTSLLVELLFYFSTLGKVG